MGKRSIEPVSVMCGTRYFWATYVIWSGAPFWRSIRYMSSAAVDRAAVLYNWMDPCIVRPSTSHIRNSKLNVLRKLLSKQTIKWQCITIFVLTRINKAKINTTQFCVSLFSIAIHLVKHPWGKRDRSNAKGRWLSLTLAFSIHMVKPENVNSK